MSAALLIIDVQRGIDEAAHWGGNRNNPGAEQNIRVLLEHWRKNDWPVIVVQHCSRWQSSPFHPEKEGNKVKQFVAFTESELVRKTYTNAFLGTNLQEKLNRRKIDEVVITGFVTNNSVEATARMSGELDYKTTVVSDATACFDKKGLDGTIYPADLIHQVSLSNLDGEYACIRSTDELLDIINISNHNRR